MALDKKSIIQILILVALLGAAAGAYLMQQEDGLEFIADLFPQDDNAAPATPAPAPSPKATIPAHPVKGQIAGAAFAPDSAVFESGALAFVQSGEPQAAVLIRLPAPTWEVPAGKSFAYAPAGTNAPVITVKRMQGAEMVQQTHVQQYTLLLEFGAEGNGKLPGKLSLKLTDTPQSVLAGTFEADIKGFRFVNGQPDLKADSTATLEYLALRELLKDDPDKNIELLAFRDARYTAAAEGKPVGYLEVEYRVAAGSAEIKRLQFVKEKEWAVRATLTSDQINEAHPLVVPGENEPAQRMAYLAAKRLEADMKKKSPKNGIYGVSFLTRHNVRTKMGVAEASYRTSPDGQVLRTAYLFRLRPKGWALERELTAKEKANVETGKLEKR